MARKYYIKLSQILILMLLFSCININADISNSVRDSKKYKDWIKDIVEPAGYLAENIDGFHANMDIYYRDQDEHKAFKIVYGDDTDITTNDKDDKGEWRYLGFDMSGNLVSNEDFTNDRET